MSDWNWERVLFAALGLGLLGFCVCRVIANDITSASALFAMAFFSFFYSNISRFKRFKGLGFEAELWEDKQEQAQEVLERLETVFQILTKQALLAKIGSGRFHPGPDWSENWSLVEQFRTANADLGFDGGIAEIKSRMDAQFAFDVAVTSVQNILAPAVQRAKNATAQKRRELEKEQGRDSAELKRLNDLLASCPSEPGRLSKVQNPVKTTIEWALGFEGIVQEEFGVSIMDQEPVKQALSDLRRLAEMLDAGDLLINDELQAIRKRYFP